MAAALQFLQENGLTDYDALAERKKKLYAQYRAAQQEMREAVAVKANIDHLLDLPGGRENKAQER